MKSRFVVCGAVALIYAAAVLVSCDKDETTENGGVCTCSYYDVKAGRQVNDEKFDLRAEESASIAEGEPVHFSGCSDFAAWLEDDELTHVSCK